MNVSADPHAVRIHDGRHMHVMHRYLHETNTKLHFKKKLLLSAGDPSNRFRNEEECSVILKKKKKEERHLNKQHCTK